MKKSLLIITILLLIALPNNVYAQRGCCSHHGGVAYCGNTGYYVCNDGSRSPSCTCSGGVRKTTTKKSTTRYVPPTTTTSTTKLVTTTIPTTISTTKITTTTLLVTTSSKDYSLNSVSNSVKTSNDDLSGLLFTGVSLIAGVSLAYLTNRKKN